MSDQAFTAMAGGGVAEDVPRIGVGMLGYAFMGKAHSNAFKTLPYMVYPPPAVPVLAAICGRNEGAVQDAAARFGYARAYTDWREMIADDSVQLFDNGGPNDAHAEPCIAAAQAGKHVLCEKPLGRTAEESRTMLDAVEAAGVKHMVAFNYRFVPAIRQIPRAHRQRQARPHLPLPRGVPAGVDHAALRHSGDLAAQQERGRQRRARRSRRAHHRLAHYLVVTSPTLAR